ncbi:conserved hypothetical protein [Trichinella spiralis]|uniref:hypothetical protein n=1 Tax=Trichinella spiralis TaxID=6334 RepID=UPI0001EFD900|nr:conserved hypothetical protein [Trichinella spiralis]
MEMCVEKSINGIEEKKLKLNLLLANFSNLVRIVCQAQTRPVGDQIICYSFVCFYVFPSFALLLANYSFVDSVTKKANVGRIAAFTLSMNNFQLCKRIILSGHRSTTATTRARTLSLARVGHFGRRFIRAISIRVLEHLNNTFNTHIHSTTHAQ